MKKILKQFYHGATKSFTPEKTPSSENPWIKIAGKYKDDPQFDDMLADIEAYRRERDAQMEEYYRQMDAEEEQLLQ